MDSFKKQPRWIQVGLGLLVAILLIVIFSSLGGDDDDDDDRDDSLGPAPVAAAQVPVPQAADPVTAGEIGSPLTHEAVTITPDALVRGESLLGEQYSCSTVQYANGGDKEVRLSPFDWKLQIPSGTVLNPSPWGSDDQLPYGEVAAGGSAQGDVCFEVDVKDGGTLQLIYEPSFWSDDRLTWSQAG